MITKNTSKWFRFMAIIMVVASHYAEWLGELTCYEDIRNFICTLGVYGVSIFFLLSGYGLVKSAWEHGVNHNFICKRILTVYLPYFCTVLVITLMDGGFKSVKDLFQFLVGYDYWFMMNLFVFYLLFFLFWQNNLPRKSLLTLGIVLYSFYLYAVGRADFWIISNLSFLVGICFADYEEKLKSYFRKNIVRLVIIGISIIIIVITQLFFSNPFQILWKVVINLFFTISILMLCLMIKIKEKIIPTFGSYSLYIYLLHSSLYSYLMPFMGKYAYGIKIVFLFAVTVITSMVVGHIFQILIDYILKDKDLRRKP